jgi:hypothetical protein
VAGGPADIDYYDFCYDPGPDWTTANYRWQSLPTTPEAAFSSEVRGGNSVTVYDLHTAISGTAVFNGGYTHTNDTWYICWAFDKYAFFIPWGTLEILPPEIKTDVLNFTVIIANADLSYALEFPDEREEGANQGEPWLWPRLAGPGKVCVFFPTWAFNHIPFAPIPHLGPLPPLPCNDTISFYNTTNFYHGPNGTNFTNWTTHINITNCTPPTRSPTSSPTPAPTPDGHPFLNFTHQPTRLACQELAWSTGHSVYLYGVNGTCLPCINSTYEDVTDSPLSGDPESSIYEAWPDSSARTQMLGEAVRMALTRPGIIDIDHTYARADWTRCNSVNNRRRCDTGEFYTNIQLFVEPRDGSPDSSEPTLTHQEYESRSHLGLLNRLYALSNNSYDISDFLLNLTAELNKTDYVMQDGFYLDASEVRFEGNAQSYAAHHGIAHQPEPVGWFYSVDRRFEDWHYNEITQEYKQRTTEDRDTVFQCTAGRPCKIRLSCPTADCVDLKGAGDNFPAAVIVNPSAGENCSKLSGIPLEDAYDEATAVLPAGFDAANVPSGCRKPCYAVGAVNANPAGGDDPELSPNSLLEFNFETLGVAYGEPSHEYQVCFAAYDDCAAGVVGCVVGYNFAHSRTRTSDYWETATFAFVGPDRNQNYTCSLGWYCRIDPNGTRLSTLNMLTIDEDGDLRSCTRGDVETTFKGITSADGYKYFHEYVAGTGQEYWTFPTPLVPSNKYASFDLYYTTACSPTGWKPDSCAGAYTLCWAHDPRLNADYNIAFGRLHIAGPWTAPKFSCTLGLPCTATITGYLLPTVAGMSIDNPRRRLPNPPAAGSGILATTASSASTTRGRPATLTGLRTGPLVGTQITTPTLSIGGAFMASKRSIQARGRTCSKQEVARMVQAFQATGRA